MTGGSKAAKLAATLARRPATMRVGGQSETGRLLSVAVKRAGDAFGSEAAGDRQWRELGYTARPELAAATPEYERFLALLGTAGGGGVCLPPAAGAGLAPRAARGAAVRGRPAR